MQIKIFTGTQIERYFLKLMSEAKDKDRMKIMNSILYIVTNHNGNPTPPLAKPLNGIEGKLNEFRIALGDTLIRINYFIDYENNFLVILNRYEKPNGASDKESYNKAKGKKLDKLVQESIQEALLLQKDYSINNKDYELLN